MDIRSRIILIPIPIIVGVEFPALGRDCSSVIVSFVGVLLGLAVVCAVLSVD